MIDPDIENIKFNPIEDADAAFREKLADAWEIPGFTIDCDPEEAERAGVFIEDALSESEAIESAHEDAA